MLKLLAATVLVFAMWGIGLEFNGRLRRREKRLYRLLDGLLCIESEIRACLSSIPAALSAAGRYDHLFEKAACLSLETDIGPAFAKAVEEEYIYNNEEKEILFAFGAGLSATDERGQLQNLAVCRERLSQVAKAAQNDAARLGRLYSGGGALFGLLIVILLF